jgi:hypothetical protein
MANTKKRFRRPKVKEGELRMYWGKLPHDAPDIVIEWRGEGMKHDSNLLYYVLCSDRPDYFARPLFSKMEPSLIKELESRGYDITTLKFSIMKKQPMSISPHPSPYKSDQQIAP